MTNARTAEAGRVAVEGWRGDYVARVGSAAAPFRVGDAERRTVRV